MKNIYLQLFTTFAKIGAFTIGGGYAMIPLIEDEVVNRKKWIDSEEMVDIIAIAQSSPGLLAVNVSIFVGYRLCGTKGSIIATLGSILPSFITILAIATVFSDFTQYRAVEAIFKGIRPVVVALIALPVINMLKRFRLSWFRLAYGALAFTLIVFGHISPTYIILAALALSIAYSLIKTKKESK